MSFLADFPKHLEHADVDKLSVQLNCNCHIHTPYSFSGFNSVEQVFELAKYEKIKVAGINDFFTFDGYDHFNNLALKNTVFPLYGIEFIGLIKTMQDQNIKINDPSNPGRIYFCGKGINYPVNKGSEAFKKIVHLQVLANEQSLQMIDALNNHLEGLSIPLRFSFDNIQSKYARQQVRERHIAKALRYAVINQVDNSTNQANLLGRILETQVKADIMEDATLIENLIREKLLKKGGKAFVAENPEIFLSLDQIINIVLETGGIPCYPVLLDYKDGQFTDFEKDWEKMYQQLIEWKVGCIELIPLRNEIHYLEEFMKFFQERNFVITLGSEHNTPNLFPLTIKAKKNTPLQDSIRSIANKGCAVIAAHQYLKAQGKQGYITIDGSPDSENLDDYVKLGMDVLNHYFNTN